MDGRSERREELQARTQRACSADSPFLFSFSPFGFLWGLYVHRKAICRSRLPMICPLTNEKWTERVPSDGPLQQCNVVAPITQQYICFDHIFSLVLMLMIIVLLSVEWKTGITPTTLNILDTTKSTHLFTFSAVTTTSVHCVCAWTRQKWFLVAWMSNFRILKTHENCSLRNSCLPLRGPIFSLCP